MSADVELQNVSVTFGSFYAAKNVSVKIQEGEFFSFLALLVVVKLLCFVLFLVS